MKEEFADVWAYCINMADFLSLNKDEILVEKMKKNSEKYPVDKVRGIAAKYDKL